MTKKKVAFKPITKPRNELVGKCPYCSGQLREKDSETLICGQHFVISRAKYLGLWGQYDEGNINAVTLLEGLQDGNTGTGQYLNLSLEKE